MKLSSIAAVSLLADSQQILGESNNHHSLPSTNERRSLKQLPEEFDSCDEAFGPHFAEGVWTSRGYGFAIEVNANQTCTIYQETTTSCIEDTYFFDWYLLGNFTQVDDDTFSVDMDQQVDIVWDRSDSFQSGCANGVTPSLGSRSDADYVPDALRTFDFFDQAHVELYAFFEVRGVDWDAVTAEARSTLSSDSTDQELLDAMSSCIYPLQDYHSLIRTPNETVSSQGLPIYEQLFLEWTNQTEIQDPEVYFISQVLAWAAILSSYMDDGSTGGAPVEPGIFWGTIDNGDIGYLQLNSMGWGDDQEETFAIMDTLMTEDWSNASTLILDLRVNEGGNDRSALRVASYFVEEQIVAFTKRTMVYPDSWTPIGEIFIEPNRDVQFQGDSIILILSDSCGSACETGTLAFMQSPKFSTSIGRNTIGAMSYNTQRRMDNDWLVYTSNEEYATPQGDVYEGVGIPPDVLTETDLLPLEERQQGYDSWLELALEIARGETTMPPSPPSATTPAPAVSAPTEAPVSMPSTDTDAPVPAPTTPSPTDEPTPDDSSSRPKKSSLLGLATVAGSVFFVM